MGAVDVPVQFSGVLEDLMVSNERHVPRSATQSGRMLNADPPCTEVTETTAGRRGGSRRETIV